METHSPDSIGLDLVTAFNSHDLEKAISYFSEDYVGEDVGQATPHNGPDGLKRILEDYFRAFPDLSLTCEDTVVDSDRIVQIWSARGTHKGRLMHIPPTDRQVEIRGVSVLTLRQGLIERGLYMWDVAGLLRALGLLPEL